jgi:hypothetical protein
MELRRGASLDMLATMAGHFCPVLLIEADWPDGMVRLHTGTGDLNWGGEVWQGSSWLVQFQAPEEAGGLATSEASIKVAASIEDILAERGKVIRNRMVKVWFATTTTPGGNVLQDDPVDFFAGYFDSRTGSLARAGENLSHDMILGLGIGPSARASASITHSYEDQVSKYPQDTAGRHVQNAINRVFNAQQWPE